MMYSFQTVDKLARPCKLINKTKKHINHYNSKTGKPFVKRMACLYTFHGKKLYRTLSAHLAMPNANLRLSALLGSACTPTNFFP